MKDESRTRVFSGCKFLKCMRALSRVFLRYKISNSRELYASFVATTKKKNNIFFCMNFMSCDLLSTYIQLISTFHLQIEKLLLLSILKRFHQQHLKGEEPKGTFLEVCLVAVFSICSLISPLILQ